MSSSSVARTLALSIAVFLGVASARADDLPAPADDGPVRAAPPPVPGPRARVHVKAPPSSFLYRRAAGTNDFVTACEAPCDVEMPIGDTYKIGGNGFSTTPEFLLAASPGGSVELTIDGPNWAGIVGGGLLAVGGILVAYVGVLVALVEDTASDGQGNASGRKDSGTTLGVGGALAVGAGMVGLGLAIVFPSMKTDFSQSKTSQVKDAFLRTPTWRAASSAPEGQTLGAFPLVYERRF